MQTVDIAPIRLDRLEGLIGPTRWHTLQTRTAAALEGFDGRAFWHVNATATGGGVAEMLQILLAYVEGTGIDTQWLVLDGDPEFFAITKRLHNLLHGTPGDGGPLGEAERLHYESVMAHNGQELAARVKDGDVLVLHDPQTAGLFPWLAGRDVATIWRSHIGRDEPNEHTEMGWAFLEPYLGKADAVVVSRRVYAPPSVAADRVVVIGPSIDPFSAKNIDLSEEIARRTLVRAGLQEGEDDGEPITFPRRHGGTGNLGSHTDGMVEGGPVPADTPYVLQVSRWDRLKDMPGVMRAFVDASEVPEEAHLVLAGPAVEGVTDDPEGAEVLEECRELWRSLPERDQARVHLAALSMDDVDENAHMVNALQQRAAVVVQKSLYEGFGLTVTEAMWKSRPMVASAVGGIQDQIQDGVTGLLLPDPHDLKTAGQLMGRLLTDPDLAKTLGDAARQRVFEEYLPDRHMLQYEQLLAGMAFPHAPPAESTGPGVLTTAAAADSAPTSASPLAAAAPEQVAAGQDPAADLRTTP